MTRFNTHFLFVIRFRDILIAIQCHKRIVSNRHRICSQCQCFRQVSTIPNAARINQGNFPRLAHIFNRPACLPNRCDSGHTGFLSSQVWPSAGPTFHSIDID